MSDAALQVTGLTIGYPGHLVAADLSFCLERGSLTALMGPNGAGKSTLVKSLLELTPPLGGSVTFFGRPLARVRSHVAYVPQRSDIDLNFPITALDVVTLGTFPRRGLVRPVRGPDRDAAREALALVGLADLATAPIRALSGGQLQRVFLARALVQDADLLLLDEPLAGVDHTSERIIIDQLRALAAAGRTLLAVHHDIATAADYFDEILLLGPSITAHGPAQDVRTSEEWAAMFGATGS